jgi:uncharacterized protein (TIGR02452 family)
MAARVQRAMVARETLAVLERGSYTAAGRELLIGELLLQARHHTEFWTPEELAKELALPALLPKTPPRLEVTAEGAVTAARRAATGLPGGSVTLLNFASAKNPCGGMLKGSLAQEESIGLCSGLHACQQPFLQQYYAPHRAEPRDGLYSHRTLWSPGVPVFRDDTTLALLPEPCAVNIITSCAVNLGHFKKQVDVCSCYFLTDPSRPRVRA